MEQNTKILDGRFSSDDLEHDGVKRKRKRSASPVKKSRSGTRRKKNKKSRI